MPNPYICSLLGSIIWELTFRTWPLGVLLTLWCNWKLSYKTIIYANKIWAVQHSEKETKRLSPCAFTDNIHLRQGAHPWLLELDSGKNQIQICCECCNYKLLRKYKAPMIKLNTVMEKIETMKEQMCNVSRDGIQKQCKENTINHKVFQIDTVTILTIKQSWYSH